MDENHALTTHTGSNLDLAISAWLDAKFRKSTSERTREVYTLTITQFRHGLQRKGLDLDSEPGKVALMAQVYAAHSTVGRQVKPTTYNLRLAALSSFYVYCRKQGEDSPLYIAANPIERLDRASTQAYASAQALEDEAVYERLQAIDQSTDIGCRDYAILSVLLSTGRRAAEVHGLQWSHCQVLHDGRLRLTFEHVKGGDVLQDDLSRNASNALLRWLRRWYGDDLQLPAQAPLWVNLAEQGWGTYGEQLGLRSFSVLCKRWLGTSKVHTTRHTFAHTLEDLGAPVSEIQARLGHKSIGTTGRYLASLRRAENRKADELAARYGIE